MGIELSKDKMEDSFLQYLQDVFSHPEVKSVKVRDIIITRENINNAGKQAFEAGFHDIYSDVDMKLLICLSENSDVSPEDYAKRIDRFGVNRDTALGFMFIPADQMYRIIFKDGMRYDLGFDFEHAGNDSFELEPFNAEKENENWPLVNINRFWFIQIQALGKLYRKDYLISSHLANMNINDTLVMQMIMRDIKYGTNHHRYGYSEELEYVKELEKNPYKHNDMTFNMIADRLYAAALAYDRLAKYFYPEYHGRSEEFFAIWDWYESYRK